MTNGEAGHLADDYLQACKPSGTLAGSSLVRVEKALMADRKCHNCREGGHIQWNCPKLVQLTSSKSTADLKSPGDTNLEYWSHTGCRGFGDSLLPHGRT